MEILYGIASGACIACAYQISQGSLPAIVVTVTEDRIELNLLEMKNISLKAVIFSDFCCTFAMSLMILLVFICSTKVSEKSDMTKFLTTFCCSGAYKES